MIDFQKPGPGETAYSLTWSFFDDHRVLRLPEAHMGFGDDLSTGVKAVGPGDPDYAFWTWLCSGRKQYRGWKTQEQIDSLRSKFERHQKWGRVRNRVRSLFGLSRN